MIPNWDFLIDESALIPVLPADASHFARPVSEGLRVFLNGLPRSQQAAVLHGQAALPFDAPISQRLGALARCSPVLQKLGQVLARDRRLPESLRQELRPLESLPPSVAPDVIEQTLVRELGSLKRRGITLTLPAIAEASVAVVVPFHSSDKNGSITEGVFKVLKPGIEDLLRQELKQLERVGELLDQRCIELQIPQLDYQETFRQVHGKLVDEVCLEHEQRHLVQAKAFFASDPDVHVPELLEPCTARVTAMERIHGVPVTCATLRDEGRHRSLADVIARTMMARTIFARDERPLFHGDPHGGNLICTSDSRLGLLDWSLVGHLGVSERVIIVQILLAALTLDGPQIVTLLKELGDPCRSNDAAMRQVVESRLRRIRHGEIPGLPWVTGLLDDAVAAAGLRVSADLMLFRKALHTLEGVLADVGGSCGALERALTTEFLIQFAAEWPERCLSNPQSREFATRLSSLDVARTLFSGPAAVTRFWTGHAIDLLQSCATDSPATSPQAAPRTAGSAMTLPAGRATHPSPGRSPVCPSNL